MNALRCRARPKKSLLLVAVAIAAYFLISLLRQHWGVSRHAATTETEPYAIYDSFEAPGSGKITRTKLPMLKLRTRPDIRVGRRFTGDEEEEAELSEIFEPIDRFGKEPEWQVAKILRETPRSRSSGRPVVPVFVVEEHFEVLKHWFDAVSTGVLPSKGNTVLHIDGHSDLAPPRDLTLVPWFRLPRNHSEVANMMQSNDAFVVGSAITGLITRYIWIWPHWDKENHEGRHEVTEVRVGWRTYNPVNGKEPFRVVCGCVKMRNEDQVDWECVEDRPTASEVGEEVKTMDPADCHTVMTAVVEMIHEDRALKLLKRGGWIKKDEPLMLDIDEDYFGCETSAMPLLNAGMTMPNISDLTSIVQELLCANDVSQEAVSDKVFRAVVHAVTEFKANMCDHPLLGKQEKGQRSCKIHFDEDQAMKQLFPTVDGIFGKHEKREGAGPNTEAVTCELSNTDRIIFVRRLVRTLLHFNATELEALNYVGVCFITAPTSIWFRPGATLHVCHGFNVPGDTAVTFHVPTQKESETRSELLRETLSLLPAKPTVVTVCRSMRDGYTPWSFFEFAERAVLGALNATIEDVTDESYHYDENLLGGKKGWPNRYR